jgi:hypothetical protein
MFTQKALFILPGLGVGAVVWVLLGSRDAVFGRGRCWLYFALGLLIPFLLTWGIFAAQGGGFAFFHNNFLLNAR